MKKLLLALLKYCIRKTSLFALNSLMRSDSAYEDMFPHIYKLLRPFGFQYDRKSYCKKSNKFYITLNSI